MTSTMVAVSEVRCSRNAARTGLEKQTLSVLREQQSATSNDIWGLAAHSSPRLLSSLPCPSLRHLTHSGAARLWRLVLLVVRTMRVRGAVQSVPVRP